MFFGRVLRIVQAVTFYPLLFLTPNSPCFAQSRQPTHDHDIDGKVDELLRKMTVEEKVGQLTQSFHFAKTSDFDQRIAHGEIGSIADYFDVAEQNRLQHLAVEGSRLHIPLVFASDVIHGFRVMFPVPLGMAASWDMSMIEDVQRRAAFEARTSGQSWNFGPMLDIARDPRWGRIVEGAGEDPFLGAKIAVAQVKGFEGQGPIDEKHIATSLKHFAGYGASLGGRDHDDVNLSESQLRNVYLRPFEAGVAAGARTVMTVKGGLMGNHWGGGKGSQ
jgi:beta-glucosidase